MRPIKNLLEKKTNPLEGYRQWLIAAEQKSQEDFDKTVLSLSGGALGISFVFLKDIIGVNHVQEVTLLFISWVAWAFSTFVILASYYLSRLALQKAIKQIDDKTIYQSRAGGSYALATAILNALGAILFLIGVCFMTAFASTNLSIKGASNVRQETPCTDTKTITDTRPQTTSATATACPWNGPKGTSTNNRGIHSSATTTSKE